MFVRVIHKSVSSVIQTIDALYSTVQVCDATLMPVQQMPGTKKAPH